MNFKQTQNVRQNHDALQCHAAKAINVGLIGYLQFLGTLFQKLEAMIYTEVCKIQSRGKVAGIYELEAIVRTTTR
jgi:hypothetical protein